MRSLSGRAPGALRRGVKIKRLAVAAVLAALLPAFAARAQVGGNHTLYGDLKVEEAEGASVKPPLSFDILLYLADGTLVGRQSVSNNGRYRFLNLRNGFYDIVVEVENREVARLKQINVNSPYKNDFVQNIVMAWRADAAPKPARAATVSADDLYKRSAANQKRFEHAGAAMDKKEYDEAVAQYDALLAADPQDFQAWTELGTA
ncbi:MAG: hypothetical protein ACJ741_08185, partial [Pyrinomonadaceae bacterium]